MSSRDVKDGAGSDLGRGHFTFRHAITVTLLGVVVLLLYYPALSGPFLLDDLENIKPTLLGNLGWSELVRVASSNDSGALGRPLPVLSLAFNQYFSGLAPFSYKLVNLIIHLINGYILFHLMLALLTAASRRVAPVISCFSSPQTRIWLAACIAVVWLIHPLQLSGVMYVVQRMNLMSAGFVLLSLLIYVKLRLATVSGAIDFSLRIAAVCFFAVLAALSKENGVLIVFYLFCIEWSMFRFAGQAGIERNVIKWLYSTGALCLFLILIYLVINPDLLIGGYFRREFTLLERLLTQPLVVWTYISQILVPRISDMSLYHDNFPVATQLTGEVLTAMLGLAALLLVAILSVRRLPLLTLGICLFFTSHLLESTFVPLEMMFEHRNYFGMAGILLGVASLIAVVLQRSSGRLILFGFAAIAVTLGVQTWQRAHEWSSELMHNSIAAESRPTSRRAQISYSNTLARLGRYDEALGVLDKVNESGIDPVYFALSSINLKALTGQLETPDVVESAAVLSRHPITLAHAKLLLTLAHNVEQGLLARPNEQELLLLFQAVQESPDIRLNTRGRATMLRLQAKRLMALARWQEARTILQSALVLNESDTEAIKMRNEVQAELLQAETQD
ncbi:MAG: hypothetical protein KTR33_00210 [Gammaproteobacteria bacterium]|nr:hypothetical protein [Gammaproteobacteria bacterium]